MLKRLFVVGFAILSLSLSLPAYGAMPDREERPVRPNPTGVPYLWTTETIRPDLPPERFMDFHNLPVLLDGKTYSVEEIERLGIKDLFLALDEEQNVLVALRGPAEVKSFLGGDPTKGCTGTTKDGFSCVFYTGLNCTGTGYIVPCHNAARFPAGIRSFRTGCISGGITFLCPTADCTGNCPAAQGNPGVCINASYVGLCGGCTH